MMRTKLTRIENDETEPGADRDAPRSPGREIAELLAVALLRLRARNAELAPRKGRLDLGWAGHQSVNATASPPQPRRTRR